MGTIIYPGKELRYRQEMGHQRKRATLSDSPFIGPLSRSFLEEIVQAKTEADTAGTVFIPEEIDGNGRDTEHTADL